MDALVARFPAATPWHALLGGLMLASAVHACALQLGSPLGISGFLHSAVAQLAHRGRSSPLSQQQPADAAAASLSERTARQTASLFTAGILTGGAVLGVVQRPLQAALGVPLLDAAPAAPASVALLALQGALIGLGTRLGNGCTSGHFLSGLSRLSVRSLAATATFFGVAVATHLHLHGSAAAPAAAVLKHLSTRAPRPELWAVLLLQAPAVVYWLIVPRMLAAAESAAASRQTRTADERAQRHSHAARISAFTIGLHFAFGLGLTGMLRPSKVLGFLSLSPQAFSQGTWDPSLAFVALGGILPASFGFFTQVAPRMKHSQPSIHLAVPKWRIPTRTDVMNVRLIGGATLFGLGWGATGLCPGPVLVTTSAAVVPALLGGAHTQLRSLAVFLAALIAGGQLGALI